MRCKKCSGRVLLDRMYVSSKSKENKDRTEESNHLELYCLMCGKRWMLHKEKSSVAKWISKIEKRRAGIYATSL